MFRHGVDLVIISTNIRRSQAEVSTELIATARRLARASSKQPRQSDLKRAVSTAYYALFHTLAREGSDLLVEDRFDTNQSCLCNVR